MFELEDTIVAAGVVVLRNCHKTKNRNIDTLKLAMFLVRKYTRKSISSRKIAAVYDLRTSHLNDAVEYINQVCRNKFIKEIVDLCDKDMANFLESRVRLYTLNEIREMGYAKI